MQNCKDGLDMWPLVGLDPLQLPSVAIIVIGQWVAQNASELGKTHNLQHAMYSHK